MTQTVTQLQHLAAQAERQGYLTYEQVSCFLPDEASHSKKTELLLDMLDGLQIRLVDEVVPATARKKKVPSRPRMIVPSSGGGHAEIDGRSDSDVLVANVPDSTLYAGRRNSAGEED